MDEGKTALETTQKTIKAFTFLEKPSAVCLQSFDGDILKLGFD